MVILDSSLPLGVRYWYMKQSVEMGWSSNVLKIQIETNLYNTAYIRVGRNAVEDIYEDDRSRASFRHVNRRHQSPS